MVAMRCADLAESLRGGQVGEVGLVTLTGVYHVSSRRPEDVEDLLDPGHNGARLGKYVGVSALDLPEAAGIDKVSLDIDDYKGRCG